MLNGNAPNDGMTFILQLPDAAGESVRWTATLCGENAGRWYDLYRTSFGSAFRSEAAEVRRPRRRRRRAE